MPTRNTGQRPSSGPTILSEKAAAAKSFVSLLKQCFSHAESRYSAQTDYTGCNSRNGPDFGRVFLMLNCTEKPQNTCIQSSMVTEI